MEAVEVAALIQDQTGSFDGHGSASRSGSALQALLLFVRLSCLHRLLVVRAEKLLQVRRQLSFPGDGENGTARRNEFADFVAYRGRNFVHDIGLFVSTVHCCFHPCLIRKHGRDVVAEDRPHRQRDGDKEQGEE